jgi:transcription-repair coupling factor (superfamily II helicase)
MIDRFGPMPYSVEGLFTTVRCRRLAVEIGFERMTLTQGVLRCYFVNNPDSPYFHSLTFNAILLHLQTKTNKSILKQVGKNFMMVTDPIKNMELLLQFLKELQETINEVRLQNGITIP